jgi:hypothetical protein
MKVAGAIGSNCYDGQSTTKKKDDEHRNEMGSPVSKHWQ